MSNLIKSKDRVANHGEVFTPDWLVSEMLNLVGPETERIEAKFLEPACGSGNFLMQVLLRKLEAVEKRFKSSEFERCQQTFVSLMCVYGIELLEDNADECRHSLLLEVCRFLSCSLDSTEALAARAVLASNIINGDALSLTDRNGAPIVFPEWSYLGKGKFKRRDFSFDQLVQTSSFGEGTLFESLDAGQIFAPITEYPVMTLLDIAHLAENPASRRTNG